jgi:hypothetical protein
VHDVDIYKYFQDYILPEVRDRQYLLTFHRNAKKIGMDVQKYNQIRTQVSKIEGDLQRLRDPLALHLPLKSRLASQTDLQRLQPDSTQSIISKAHNKIQQMIQKAQQNSSSSTPS